MIILFESSRQLHVSSNGRAFTLLGFLSSLRSLLSVLLCSGLLFFLGFCTGEFRMCFNAEDQLFLLAWSRYWGKERRAICLQLLSGTLFWHPKLLLRQIGRKYKFQFLFQLFLFLMLWKGMKKPAHQQEFFIFGSNFEELLLKMIEWRKIRSARMMMECHFQPTLWKSDIFSEDLRHSWTVISMLGTIWPAKVQVLFHHKELWTFFQDYLSWLILLWWLLKVLEKCFLLLLKVCCTFQVPESRLCS